MTLGTFNPTAVFSRDADTIKISARSIWLLQPNSEVCQTHIEKAIAQTRELNSSELAALQKLMAELKTLRESAGVPIDWTQTAILREILQQRRMNQQ